MGRNRAPHAIGRETGAVRLNSQRERSELDMKSESEKSLVGTFGKTCAERRLNPRALAAVMLSVKRIEAVWQINGV